MYRIIVLLYFCFINLLVSQTIKKEDLKYSKETGDLYLEKKIKISDTVETTIMLELTSKGNGLLQILGETLHIYDSHNDQAFYENGMLLVSFIDLDKNGFKDLLISGTVCYTSEESDEIIFKEQVHFIYKFVKAEQKYVEFFRRASFELEAGATSRRELPSDPTGIKELILKGNAEAERKFP